MGPRLCAGAPSFAPTPLSGCVQHDETAVGGRCRCWRVNSLYVCRSVAGRGQASTQADEFLALPRPPRAATAARRPALSLPPAAGLSAHLVASSAPHRRRRPQLLPNTITPSSPCGRRQSTPTPAVFLRLFSPSPLFIFTMVSLRVAASAVLVAALVSTSPAASMQMVGTTAGVPCSESTGCAAGLICDHPSLTCKAWVGPGVKCGADTNNKCWTSLSCEHSGCKRWVGPGSQCGGGSNSICWTGLTCEHGTCKKWVGPGVRCDAGTNNTCWKSLSCEHSGCKRWVGPGEPCDGGSNNICWSALTCEHGTCKA
eukprot:TRINITY_DN2643_c0_g1_i1.p1 TRINITY_DN2643_c0_g1~~TRINITY_DN2643_c0_g1_i1.p1  ORF type:complete len:313 (-),score=38.64 TRINITY_DN2643_c0_g1_i1:317-1255(-)